MAHILPTEPPSDNHNNETSQGKAKTVGMRPLALDYLRLERKRPGRLRYWSKDGRFQCGTGDLSRGKEKTFIGKVEDLDARTRIFSERAHGAAATWRNCAGDDKLALGAAGVG